MLNIFPPMVLKALTTSPLGHILCLTLDLIALKALRIVNGDRNFAITGSEVFERCFQKRNWLIY